MMSTTMSPAGEMHPMYQITRLSSIMSSAATFAQRKERHSQYSLHTPETLELSTAHRRTPSRRTYCVHSCVSKSVYVGLSYSYKFFWLTAFVSSEDFAP